MPRIIFSILLLWTFALAAAEPETELGTEPVCDRACETLTRFDYLESKMAVPVRLILYAPSKEAADSAAEAVYRRFDDLNDKLSDWSPESELVRACRASGEKGEAVEISGDLYRVLAEARRFDELTAGAFDPTVSPVVKLWRRSRSFGKRPPEDYLNRAKALVGRDKWELIPPTETEPARLRVFEKNVRLDLGGIAKGFAIDEGFEILRALGLNRVLIDAGGDMRFGDAPPDTPGWRIAIASLDKETPLETRTLSNRAAATSGDTFQFLEIDGVRYSHLIDPRSGEPLTHRSVVTIFADTAAAADALASAVSVLGETEGRALIQTLPETEAAILTEE